MHKIATYGTLRKGMYNNRYFDMRFIETTTIDDFKLYDLGPYPAVVEGNGTIVVDIFEVDDNTKRAIDGMELGAGYNIKTLTINTPGALYGESVDIYVFDTPPSRAVLIESGDYVEYLKTKQNVSKG